MARGRRGAGALERLAGGLLREVAGPLADLAMGVVAEGLQRDVQRFKGRAAARRGRAAPPAPVVAVQAPPAGDEVELVEVDGEWMTREEAAHRGRRRR